MLPVDDGETELETSVACAKDPSVWTEEAVAKLADPLCAVTLELELATDVTWVDFVVSSLLLLEVEAWSEDTEEVGDLNPELAGLTEDVTDEGEEADVARNCQRPELICSNNYYCTHKL